jgi:hypothetical protein
MTRKLDKTATRILRATLTGALVALAFGAPASAAADGIRACGLLTAAELAAVLGGKLSGLQEGGGAGPLGAGPKGGSDVAFCSAQTPNASVLLRLAKKTGRAPDSAAKGVAIAKQMGAQVEVKTFGPVTCSSMVPPKNLEQYGFNTTCSVDKGTQVAAVEVTAKSQKDMVPIDKLRPLAEKMAGRF